MNRTTADLRLLLSDNSWCQRLAASLVHEDIGEDLQQEVAIASVEHLRRGGSLSKAWLKEVMRRQFGRYARSEYNRRGREQAVARSEPQPSTLDLLERVETHKAVAEAVVRLDEPYRSTVILRFWEGLRPRDIARQMDVPVETVRTRIKRALAKMREDLDRSFGSRGAWAIALVAGRPAQSIGLCVLALVGLAVLGVALWMSVDFLLTSPPVLSSGEVTEAASTVRLPPARDVETRSELVGKSSTGIWHDTCTIIGQCVATENGKPLAGCTVRITGHSSTGYALGWSDLSWQDPEPIITDANGRFRFRIRLPWASPGCGPQSRYHINIEHPDRVGFFGDMEFPLLAEHQNANYGMIRLPLGYETRLRIVDNEDKPQPGLVVYARNETRPSEKEIHAYPGRGWLDTTLYRRTDKEGLVGKGSRLSVGIYTVEVEGCELVDSSATIVVTPESAEQEPITMVIKKGPAMRLLRGRLQSADGKPISGVLLKADPGGAEWTRSQPDGSFTLRSKEGKGVVRTVVYAARKRRFDGWSNLGEGTFDGPAFQYAAGARAGYAIRVCEERSGKPVTSYRLFCKPADPNSFWGTERVDVKAEDGSKTIQMPIGRVRVFVSPFNHDLDWSGWVDGMVLGSDSTLEIQLPSKHSRTLRLANHLGKAVAGVQIDLLRGDEAGNPGVEVISGYNERTANRNYATQADLVHRSRTDRHGIAQLVAAEHDGTMAVVLTHPGYLRTVVYLTQWSDTDGELHVTMKPGASLAGRFFDLDAINALDVSTETERKVAAWKGRRSNPYGESLEDLWMKRRPCIVLLVDGEPWQDCVIPIDEEGKFLATSLPPRSYRLGLVRFVRNGKIVKRDGRIADLGPLELSVKEPVFVELSVPESWRR